MFLWERGCNIIRENDVIVRTPKGRDVQVQMWSNILYITKDELRLILSDLPEYHVVGRSVRPATVPAAARVAYAHVGLGHLRNHILREDRNKIKLKYKNLPDLYYQDEVEAVIPPERFDGLDLKVVQQLLSLGMLSCGSYAQVQVPSQHVQDKNVYRTCFRLT